MARLLPRTNAVLMGLLRPAVPAGTAVGSRIPNTLPLPYLMARRSGGSSIHPEQLDQAVVDVQSWDRTDAGAEELAQLARDVLYRASRSPQAIVPGVGYISWFDETSGPMDISTDVGDHGVYRYQATYTLNIRPDRG